MAESDVSAALLGTEKSIIGCLDLNDVSGAGRSYDSGRPGSVQPRYRKLSSRD